MADIKAQLKAKNGDNLYPVTSLEYVSAVSSGGIVISGNSIYTSAIPQANVYRLTTSLGAKQAKCSAGFRTYVSGATIGQNRYFGIAAPVSSGTLTVSAGSAYRIFATGSTVTVNAEGSASSAGVFGLEGHAAILLTNSSYLKFGTNVVLGSPLQIDAINNCTLRFHDGHCIIDVEDHEAAHAVTVATGTGTGSLYYWANWANTTSASATPAYVSFSDALDGTACSFNGVTVNGDKHFVGNGKTLTVVTGTATASSKTFLTNMAISGATITGGTVYVTDVLIPSGATTVISSPLVASNTVEINGTLRTPGGLNITTDLVINGTGVIDFNNSTRILIATGVTASASGCVFQHGSGGNGAGIYCYGGNLVMDSCTLQNNSAYSGTTYGGGLNVEGNATLNLTSCIIRNNVPTVFGGGISIANVSSGNTLRMIDCIVSSNTATYGGGVQVYNASAEFIGCIIVNNTAPNGKDVRLSTSATGYFSDCVLGKTDLPSGCKMNFAGSNVIDAVTGSGTVTISSGAILDLTGNTNATPMNPGGDITFEAGGATVYPSAGQVSSYLMNNVTLSAGAKLTNTAAVDMGATRFVLNAGSSSYASGCTFHNGYTTGRGGFTQIIGSMTLDNCMISGCTATLDYGGGINVNSGKLNLISSIVSGNYVNKNVDDIYINNTGSALYQGCNVYNTTLNKGSLSLAGSNTLNLIKFVTSSGTVTISSGAILDLIGNTNTTPINPGGGVIVNGGCTVINSAGASVSIAGGTYTKINKDGTTA